MTICGARASRRRPRTMHPDDTGTRRRSGRAIFSVRHPGIPLNPYWISVLILNLPEFSELAPPYIQKMYKIVHGYMLQCDHLRTPTQESHCDGPTQVSVRACVCTCVLCVCLCVCAWMDTKSETQDPRSKPQEPIMLISSWFPSRYWRIGTTDLRAHPLLEQSRVEWNG